MQNVIPVYLEATPKRLEAARRQAALAPAQVAAAKSPPNTMKIQHPMLDLHGKGSTADPRRPHFTNVALTIRSCAPARARTKYTPAPTARPPASCPSHSALPAPAPRSSSSSTASSRPRAS